MSRAPGTNTLEKKNKDLNKATRELEAKMKNLQQKTRSLPKVTQSAVPAHKVTGGGLAGRLRELPSTPSEGRKGSTVTSRAREREADFQKQVKYFLLLFNTLDRCLQYIYSDIQYIYI